MPISFGTPARSGGADLSSLARVGQGERFTPASGSRFTAVSTGSSGGAPRTSQTPRLLTLPDIQRFEPTALQTTAAAGSGVRALANLTGQDIGPLGPLVSGANLLARFQNPTASAPRLALGTASDLSSIVGNSTVRDLVSRLSPEIGARFTALTGPLRAAAPFLGLGTGALSLAEGDTAGGVSQLVAGGVPLAAAGIEAAGLPAGLSLAGAHALEAGAAVADLGATGAGAAPGLGSAVAGPAAIVALIALNALKDPRAPGGLEPFAGVGRMLFGGKASLAERQAKEKALQAHLARGAIDHMKNVVAGGFQIPDIMAYMTSPSNASNQGFAGPETAEFRSAVSAGMMDALARDIEQEIRQTGKPFVQVWFDRFTNYADNIPGGAGGNRSLARSIAGSPQYIGQANYERLAALTPGNFAVVPFTEIPLSPEGGGGGISPGRVIRVGSGPDEVPPYNYPIEIPLSPEGGGGYVIPAPPSWYSTAPTDTRTNAQIKADQLEAFWAGQTGMAQ